MNDITSHEMVRAIAVLVEGGTAAVTFGPRFSVSGLCEATGNRYTASIPPIGTCTLSRTQAGANRSVERASRVLPDGVVRRLVAKHISAIVQECELQARLATEMTLGSVSDQEAKRHSEMVRKDVERHLAGPNHYRKYLD